MNLWLRFAWRTHGGGAGTPGGGLQSRAGHLVPDAFVAEQRGRAFVAVAVLALHVADAVGGVGVGADVAGASHGAPRAAPEGRGEAQRAPPGADVSARRCCEHLGAPMGAIGSRLDPFGGSHWCRKDLVGPLGAIGSWVDPWGHPEVTRGGHTYLVAPIAPQWHPLLLSGTHCSPMAPIDPQ